MKEENSLFSFFANIKDKITSFFSSIGYSSEQNVDNLIPAINNKFYRPTEEKNNITYLMSKKPQKSIKYFNNKKWDKKSSQSFMLSDEDTSIGLSETYSKDELDLCENRNLDLLEEYDYICLNSNNYINRKNYLQNNYQNNCEFIGKKYPRNFFEQENNDIFSEICKYKYLDSELNRYKKKKQPFNKNTISKTILEKNDKHIRRISKEFSSYKAKLKLKNKINNHFLNQLQYNDKINIDILNKKEKNQNNIRPPFDNLSFTHPERFSFYSTQKKVKLENNESKNKKKSNLFSISTENNINIIQNPKKLNNIGNINISPIESCDNSKIFNVSSDFTFGENCDNKSKDDDNNINLSKLLDENVNNSLCFKQNNNANSKIDNLNGGLCSVNNNNNTQDYFMDIDENNLIIGNKSQNNHDCVKVNNIFPQTMKNNPFLSLNNTCENKGQNENNNENIINANIISKNELFKGKNLFNINENNNKKELNNLNFSFGKA